jgi:hypothetical protein
LSRLQNFFNEKRFQAIRVRHSVDVGSTVEYFSKNGFHHPWRSTGVGNSSGDESRSDSMRRIGNFVALVFLIAFGKGRHA